MTSYLIKSALCLGLLLVFYHFFLEKEKMHRFNRFYLLGSVLFSFLAPLYVIYIEPTGVEETPISIVTGTRIEETQTWFTLQNGLLALYLIISGLLLIRFLKNLFDIGRKIIQNEKRNIQNARLVLVNDKILPHTFWNYIFVNKTEFENNAIEEELFTHELTHATQRHTLDVLLVEVLLILFWFNPFILWLKKAVQLNHEFLADDKVLSSHYNISYYQHLLLDKAAWNNKFYLASNLNYSLTKKRLIMMKTPSSKISILVKKLAVIPILVGAVFLFADRVEAQSKKKPTVIKVENVKKSATREQMKEYNTLLNKSVKSQMFKFDEIKRMRYLYSLMSAKQKKSVKNVYEFIPPPPPPVKVVKGKKTPPPPPPPAKIIIKEVKSKKPSKEKMVERTVIEIRENKTQKPSKETVEEKIIEEIHEEPKENEVEIIEVIEESKESDWDAFEKKMSDPNYKKKVIRKKVDLEIPFDKSYTYYLNGKKVSMKKARRFVDKNKGTIKSVDVSKTNDKGTVKITTE
ncbi:MAG: hypothetical protein CMB99_13125 [Flavobacteriaceae bacterium]|nr:hypothetical protein [Flavobacteriaceae bacterium]|tara:strand:+ start:5646 stop:7199 length:1554 start_codon:yes stop_codon:yes gene_type:complete